MNTYPIVDAWMQHPTRHFLEQPFLASLRRWIGMEEVPEIPLEMTLSVLANAGVDIGITSAWYGPGGALVSNDFVADAVARSGGRLKGLASVNLYQPMDAVRELRRRVKDDGFIGLRVLPWLWNLPPNDRRYYPLYAECCELGVPFCTQAGHTGPLCPSEPGRPIPYLDEVALDFPELKIIAGHIGYPWTEEMIALATKYPQVYIDTSAYKPSRYPEVLVKYMQGNGRKKVLFGTNYPMIMPDACLAQMDALGLDDEARALFLGGNAVRVFGL